MKPSPDSEALARAFNERDSEALGRVYTLFYDELLYFATKIYAGTSAAPADAVQDVFVKVWEKRDTRFNNLEHVKAYLYVSIRNHFRDYLTRRSVERRYLESVKLGDDYLFSRVIEAETLAELKELAGALRGERARVFKLHVEGWNVKEISEKLGKAASTVYTQRQEAIDALKKMNREKLLSLLFSLL
jgi:RNA polymerase sigma-70 factor (ECF subfamily)